MHLIWSGMMSKLLCAKMKKKQVENEENSASRAEA